MKRIESAGEHGLGEEEGWFGEGEDLDTHLRQPSNRHAASCHIRASSMGLSPDYSLLPWLFFFTVSHLVLGSRRGTRWNGLMVEDNHHIHYTYKASKARCLELSILFPMASHLFLYSFQLVGCSCGTELAGSGLVGGCLTVGVSKTGSTSEVFCSLFIP